MLGKLASAQEAHGAPPGLYLVLFFATFYPGSILAGLAAPAVWTVRREPAARFLLAWLVPSWIVFELVVTKLPHYVLPLYPAIAILIAGAVESKVLSRRPWLVRGAAWWFIAPILISIAAVTFAIIVARDPAFPAWPFFAVAIICGLFAWLLYEDDGAERALLRATAGMVMLAIGVFSIIMPWLRPVFPSVALARVLHDAGCAHPLAASAGYEEPSLVFLAGTETRLTDAASAADFLNGGACRFAFIESRQERAFARVPMRSGCNTPVDRASTATTSAPAGRSASRFSLPQARREWRQGLGLVCAAAKRAEEFSAMDLRARARAARERAAAVRQRDRRSHRHADRRRSLACSSSTPRPALGRAPCRNGSKMCSSGLPISAWAAGSCFRSASFCFVSPP